MKKGLLVLAAVSLWTGVASAQEDIVGARALGMGEAQRATASGAEGPILNPSTMALTRQYAIEAQYGIKIEGIGNNVNVAIIDSVTSKVAAGLAYTFVYANPRLGYYWAGGKIRSAEITRTGHEAGLSLALPLGDKFILGATLKYLYFNTTAPLPTGAIPGSLTLDHLNGITFDVSALLRLGKFNIAAIGYNLWDHGSRETPLSLGLAIGFVPTQSFNINFDAVTNFTGYETYRIDANGKVTFQSVVTGRLGGGMEYIIKQRVPLRIGALYDTGNTSTYLTGGLGYLGQKVGIDLGYRGKVQGGMENFLMIGLRVFVN